MDIIDKLKALNEKSVEKWVKASLQYYCNFSIGRWNWTYFNLDIFSKKKTNITLGDLTDKLYNFNKYTQNKKYLFSMYPFYILPNHIVDIEGNVLMMKYGKIVGNYSNTLWLITSELYNSGNLFIEHLKANNYSFEVVNVKDIYEVFFKTYEFKSLDDLKNFQQFAINKVGEKIEYLMQEKRKTKN